MTSTTEKGINWAAKGRYLCVIGVQLVKFKDSFVTSCIKCNPHGKHYKENISRMYTKGNRNDFKLSPFQKIN